MFELQMKEAMQLLGLTSSTTILDDPKLITKQIVSEFNEPDLGADKIEVNVLTNYDHKKTCLYSYTDNVNRHHAIFPVDERDPLTRLSDYSMNSFLSKYQTDFVDSSPLSIDNYHSKILNKHQSLGNFNIQLGVSKSQTENSKSSSNTVSSDTSFTQTKSTSLNDEPKESDKASKTYDEVLSNANNFLETVEKPSDNLNSSRASELRHFIGKLLDKPPKDDMSDKQLQNPKPFESAPSAKLSLIKSTMMENNSTCEPIVDVDKLGFRPIRSSFETGDGDTILNENDYYHQFNQSMNKNFNDFKRLLTNDSCTKKQEPNGSPTKYSFEKLTVNNDDGFSKPRQSQNSLKSPISLKDSVVLNRPLLKTTKPVWK
jgi:hypothetical protein